MRLSWSLACLLWRGCIPTTEHLRLQQEASDFVRWGRRGSLRTLALYDRPYFSLLAAFRWGRVGLEALIEYRAVHVGAEASR